MQIRLFNKGCAVKGTLLLNKKVKVLPIILFEEDTDLKFSP